MPGVVRQSVYDAGADQFDERSERLGVEYLASGRANGTGIESRLSQGNPVLNSKLRFVLGGVAKVQCDAVPLGEVEFGDGVSVQRQNDVSAAACDRLSQVLPVPSLFGRDAMNLR